MIKILNLLLKPLVVLFRNFYKSYIKIKVRSNLKNKDFTLITSTCIGGVIYSLCGERFNSPTINLWIRQPEFCEFCYNLKYYLEQDLVFIKNTERNCPVAKLGDKVNIVFVHYKTEKEAREYWEIHKKKN